MSMSIVERFAFPPASSLARHQPALLSHHPDRVYPPARGSRVRLIKSLSSSSEKMRRTRTSALKRQSDEGGDNTRKTERNALPVCLRLGGQSQMVYGGMCYAYLGPGLP